jgi:hypothetical protein
VLIKGLILYSLPYIVGVASSIVAARQLVPSLDTLARRLSDTPAKGDVFLGQVVNRASHREPITRSAGRHAPTLKHLIMRN